MSARAVGLALLFALVAALAQGCRATASAPPALAFELTTEFEGAHAFEPAKLAQVVHQELVRLEIQHVDRAAIDDAAFALEVFYRTRGFADVQVDYALLEPAGAPPSARFTIVEGPVVRVREFTVEGANALSAEGVRAYFGPKDGHGLYDAERLATGVEALDQHYLEKGYLRIAIDDPRVERVAPEEVTIALTLREGPAFRVKDVLISGGVPALAGREDDRRKKLLEREEKEKERLPLAAAERELEGAVREDYQRAGYHDVALATHSTLDEQSGDVRIEVTVTPGERVTIAAIRIVGNVRTRDAAVLSTLRIAPGSRYDPEEIRRAFRDLYATGLFESVALELEGSGPERTLLVSLAEARSVQIRVEPGIGSYEGPRILLGISESNFRGLAQVLSLEGSVSGKAQTGKIAWIDHDFFGTRLAAEATLFVEQRQEPSFDYLRRGFSFFLRQKMGPYWIAGAGYEFKPTEVDAAEQAIPVDLEDNANVGEISTSLALDDRDNLLLPTRGRRAFMRFEWADEAFASQSEFLRAQVEFTQLFKVGEGVLGASARSGVMAPFGSTTEIPLPERFFNGGENSVRSFKEDELGPKDLTGDPIGGESSTTLSLEYRRALLGSVDGALFVDAGNVTARVQDYWRFQDFRYAVGVGLRYLLPIGPLRIDLGVNPDPREDEDDYVLQFSVGFPF